MDAQTASEVLLYMRASFGHVETDELTFKVWADNLRDVPAEEGEAIAVECVQECPHFPNVHEYRDRWKAMRRRQADATPSIEEPPASKSVQAYYLGIIREKMKFIGSDEAPPPDAHRHTGAVPQHGDVRDHCEACRAEWRAYLDQQAKPQPERADLV